MEWKKTKVSAGRDWAMRKHGVEIIIDTGKLLCEDGRIKFDQRTQRRAFWHGAMIGVGIEWEFNGEPAWMEHTLDDNWLATHARPGERDLAAYKRHGLRMERTRWGGHVL